MTALSCGSCSHDQQEVNPRSWEAGEGLTGMERDVVVRDALERGFERPQRIVRIPANRPCECQCSVVALRSALTIEGVRRNWTEHSLVLYERAGCTLSQPGQPLGPWMVQGESVEKVSEWRVSDGRWWVDVRIGRGVAYEDAAAIVRAIRRATVVSRMGWLPEGLSAAAGSITNIDLETRRGSPLYWVRIESHSGTGLDLGVEIVNGVVEVHDAASWVA
jgi:hypothetical protein